MSNNYAPIKIEEGDRRYFVADVSPEQVPNKEYWKSLYASFTPEFYRHLLTFFLTIDISNWNIKEIPITQIKIQLIQFSKSICTVFIQTHIEQFRDGFPKADAFLEFKKWCKSNNYKQENQQDFRLGVLQFCEDLESTYKLKNQYITQIESHNE